MAAAMLLAVSGCDDNPFADDYRIVKYSPAYLRAAYVYTDRNATRDADENFRVGIYRLYGAAGFGTYYPGCAPEVGEKLARRYGTTLLTAPAADADIDARDYYREKALTYAASYNAEMVRLLGTLPKHRR